MSRQGRNPADLPAPVGPRGRQVSDLPAPVGPGQSKTGKRSLGQPGAPVAAAVSPSGDDDVIDLLTPLSPDQIANRPVTVAKPVTPATSGDGFFDDLPVPADASGLSAGDSLAPRGFFDDLPAPASGGGASGGLAPSGFFDDIPMSAETSSDDDLLAPKEDFDLGNFSGAFAAMQMDDVLSDHAGLEMELGASGTTGEHEVQVHDVGHVPDLELGAPGSSFLKSDPASVVGLDLDAEPDVGLDLDPASGVSLDLDATPGVSLELDAAPEFGLDLDPAPDAAPEFSLDLDPALDAAPEFGLDLDEPFGMDQPLALDMPPVADDGAGPLDGPLGDSALTDPVDDDDGMVDFNAAFESGLRLSETDFSSYTNPGLTDNRIGDPADTSDAASGDLSDGLFGDPLSLDGAPLDGSLDGSLESSRDSFANLQLDPLPDSGSDALSLGLEVPEPASAEPLGLDQPASERPNMAPDMALDLDLGLDLSLPARPESADASTDLPSISLPAAASLMTPPPGPELPSIGLPPLDLSAELPLDKPAEQSLSLADGLEFDLPEPGQTAAAQPLLEIGLPDPETDGPGGQSSDPPMDLSSDLSMDLSSDLSMELAGGSAGGHTARSGQAARLERALDKKNEEEEAPALTLDADVVAEVESNRKAVSGAALPLPVDEDEDAEPTSGKPGSRRALMIAVAVVGLGALGAGGFFGFKYFKGKKDKEAAVQKELIVAIQHLRAGTPGHWQQAAQAARRALDQNSKHSDALGIAAQAYFAAYLDEGVDGPRLVQQGRQLIGRINQNAASGPQVDKARALLAIIEFRPAQAVSLLEQATRAVSAPDPDALLYLGWALYESDKPGQAEAKFAQAQAAAPGRPIPALYGLGLARLQLGKRKNALNNFDAVLENDPDHLGALIGRAEAIDVERFSERERMFLDIVKRDNIDKAPPHLIAKAWSLAGNQALQAGRLPDARERYEKALEASKRSVEANLGLAKVALGLGELAAVHKPLDEILKNQPDHLEAKLLSAELSVKEGDFKAAEADVQKLLKREQTLESKPDRARIHVLHGQILTARADAEPKLPEPDQRALLEQAIEAYKKARELAGENDVRIAVALAELLSRTERAEEAGTILTPIKDQAKSDASLSVLLGLVYAKAKDPAEAEIWFRSALALVPDDTESRFQLGLALDAQGRVDAALKELEAAFAADKKRTDIGAELANIYESKNRDDDARALYQELLKSEDRTVVLLMRAGLFFARTGAPDKAQKLAEGILESESDNPVGLYIMGESLLGDGDYKNALRRFRDAAGIDRDPRYLEAQGRAAERLNFAEEALRSFKEASQLAPDMVAARIGEARVLIRSKSYDKAGEVLAQVLERWPKNADAYHYIGVIARRRDELKDSVKSFEKALRYDRRRAETYYEMGQAYYDLNKQRRAARALTEATRLARPNAPWLARAYLNLGYAERSRDNRRTAIKAWEAYLQLNPKDQTQVREIKKLLLRLKAR